MEQFRKQIIGLLKEEIKDLESKNINTDCKRRFNSVISKIEKLNKIKVDGVYLSEKENQLLNLLYRAIGTLMTPESKYFDKHKQELVVDLRKFLMLEGEENE